MSEDSYNSDPQSPSEDEWAQLEADTGHEAERNLGHFDFSTPSPDDEARRDLLQDSERADLMSWDPEKAKRLLTEPEYEDWLQNHTWRPGDSQQ